MSTHDAGGAGDRLNKGRNERLKKTIKERLEEQATQASKDARRRLQHKVIHSLGDMQSSPAGLQNIEVKNKIALFFKDVRLKMAQQLEDIYKANKVVTGGDKEALTKELKVFYKAKSEEIERNRMYIQALLEKSPPAHAYIIFQQIVNLIGFLKGIPKNSEKREVLTVLSNISYNKKLSEKDYRIIARYQEDYEKPNAKIEGVTFSVILVQMLRVEQRKELIKAYNKLYGKHKTEKFVKSLINKNLVSIHFAEHVMKGVTKKSSFKFSDKDRENLRLEQTAFVQTVRDAKRQYNQTVIKNPAFSQLSAEGLVKFGLFAAGVGGILFNVLKNVQYDRTKGIIKSVAEATTKTLESPTTVYNVAMAAVGYNMWMGHRAGAGNPGPFNKLFFPSRKKEKRKMVATEGLAELCGNSPWLYSWLRDGGFDIIVDFQNLGYLQKHIEKHGSIRPAALFKEMAEFEKSQQTKGKKTPRTPLAVYVGSNNAIKGALLHKAAVFTKALGIQGKDYFHKKGSYYGGYSMYQAVESILGTHPPLKGKPKAKKTPKAAPRTTPRRRIT